MSKKSGKTNPIIKDKKVKRIKNNMGASEEGNEIRNFIIIVLILAVIVVGIYGLTKLFEKEEEYVYESVAGEINYNKLIVGNILNRPYDEYYVMVYDGDTRAALKYGTLIENYMTKKDDKGYIKIYYCDLNNELNKPYYNVGDDNKSNPKAKKISELDFGDLTLLHIKKGKITEYIEDYKTIQDKLK